MNYISSSGLAVLIAAITDLRRLGGDLKIFGAHPTLLKLLDVRNLGSIFSVCASREEAIAAVSAV